MPQQIKKQMALTCSISTRDGLIVVIHPYSMGHTVWAILLSPNPLLMYIANVKDSENVVR